MKRKLRLPVITSLFLLVGLMLSLNTQAQQRRQQGPPPLPNDQQIEKMVNDLAKTLTLSENQKEKVSEKYYDHFDLVKAKVEKSKPKKEEMDAMKSDFEKDIKSILNEEQKKDFDDYVKKNQKSKRKEKPLK